MNYEAFEKKVATLSETSEDLFFLLIYLVKIIKEGNLAVPGFIEGFFKESDVDLTEAANKVHAFLYHEGILPNICSITADRIMFLEENILSKKETQEVEEHRKNCPLCKNIDPERESYLGLDEFGIEFFIEGDCI